MSPRSSLSGAYCSFSSLSFSLSLSHLLFAASELFLHAAEATRGRVLTRLSIQEPEKKEGDPENHTQCL